MAKKNKTKTNYSDKGKKTYHFEFSMPNWSNNFRKQRRLWWSNIDCNYINIDIGTIQKSYVILV